MHSVMKELHRLHPDKPDVLHDTVSDDVQERYNHGGEGQDGSPKLVGVAPRYGVALEIRKYMIVGLKTYEKSLDEMIKLKHFTVLVSKRLLV